MSAPTLREFQQQLGRLMLSMDGHGVVGDAGRYAAYTQTQAGRWLQGVSRERLFLYEELLLGGIHGVLSAMYPHTKRFFTKSEFTDLAERFRRTHPNRSFQLFRAVEAFPQFLAGAGLPQVEHYPVLLLLAQVEWAEVAVKNAPDVSMPPALQPSVPQALEEMAQFAPVWNPVATLLECPVDVAALLAVLAAIPEKESLEPMASITPKPTPLLVYRHPETGLVRQFTLTPLTALLVAQPVPTESYEAAFKRVQAQVPALHNIPLETLRAQALPTLLACLENGILLGSVRV